MVLLDAPGEKDSQYDVGVGGIGMRMLESLSPESRGGVWALLRVNCLVEVSSEVGENWRIGGRALD